MDSHFTLISFFIFDEIWLNFCLREISSLRAIRFCRPVFKFKQLIGIITALLNSKYIEEKFRLIKYKSYCIY